MKHNSGWDSIKIYHALVLFRNKLSTSLILPVIFQVCFDKPFPVNFLLISLAREYESIERTDRHGGGKILEDLFLVRSLRAAISHNFGVSPLSRNPIGISIIINLALKYLFHNLLIDEKVSISHYIWELIEILIQPF